MKTVEKMKMVMTAMKKMDGYENDGGKEKGISFRGPR
jgi:hypothetical protein